MNTSDLHTALVNAALAVLAVVPLVMTAFVVPWLRARVGDQKLRTAALLAERAVRYVEQTQEGTEARTKFYYAVDALVDLAASKGISLTAAEQDALIEAAVHDLRLTWAAVDAPPLPPLTPSNRTRSNTPATPRRTPAKRAPAKEVKA